MIVIKCHHCCFFNTRLTCSRETWATAPPCTCVGNDGSYEQPSVANDNNALILGFKSFSVFAAAPHVYQGPREEINSPEPRICLLHSRWAENESPADLLKRAAACFCSRLPGPSQAASTITRSRCFLWFIFLHVDRNIGAPRWRVLVQWPPPQPCN